MTQTVKTCYRHPERPAGVSCQRCDKPICPACMVQASVGFHCPECARGARQKVYTARSLGQLNRPVATQTLIALNVAVFLIGLSQGGQAGGGLFNASGGSFQDDWALIGSGFLRGVPIGVANGEWYRVITGGFLHASGLHILMNMAALWFIGSQLESALGRLRFGIVYGASLLAGSLGVMLVTPNSVTVGASGAIFGLLGAMVAAQRSKGINLWQSGIGGLVVINLLFTFGVSGISIGAHIGGLVGGLVCGEIVFFLTSRKQGALANALCVVVGLVCFAGALVAAQASA
ncbi:MAG: rhomboid family intramembrane serine protease [Acidimicrobiales bacterium]